MLLLATDLLEIVAINISDPLQGKEGWSCYLFLISDRYSKFTKIVPVQSSSVFALYTHWVFLYGPPVNFLASIGSNFASKFFQTVYLILGMKEVFTMTYHPQAIGLIERYKGNIFTF